LRREVERNRYLQEEIARLATAKEYQAKYCELSSDLESSQQENRALREQLSSIKEEVLQASSDKTQTIQRLKYELSLQRDKESARIEHLEEELASKQDECDRVQREGRNREKEMQEVISNLKNKMDVLAQEHDAYLRSEQRKADRLERDLMTRSSCLADLQSSNESLQKENSQMKEEIFRLSSMLGSR
jgi:chromosome segregation ATPase